MLTSLALLLLLLSSLGFWIVKASQVPATVKVTMIVLFCAFCVFMATTIDSSMGWAAIGRVESNIPEKITIRHVVIREPNEQLGFKGSIYLLLDMSETKSDTALLKIFAHKPEGLEPRLFRLPYNRTFHEELQKYVIPRLLKGQTFHGRLKKGTGEGNGGEGDAEGISEGDNNSNGQGKGQRRGSGQRGNGYGRRGQGYDNRETETHIYELPPSEYMPK